LRDRLHRHRINTDGFVRLGTSEITRLGYTEAETRRLAALIASLLNDSVENSAVIDDQIATFIATHDQVVL
jgi:glycine hydroxymethyltransferase